LLGRAADLVDHLDGAVRDGLVLAPETAESIGRAEARGNRSMTIALWVIAGLLGWLILRIG
jgi:ubiquinone biosynthesis protein